MTNELDANGPNAEQIRYWNDTAGAKWVAQERFIDAMIEPFGRIGMDWAAPRTGERVLDVGCGCGSTTIELARRVGEAGTAQGVDISSVMLDQARRSAAEQGVSNVAFRQADAQTCKFDHPFDIVFSRFGVMFFQDPEAAFTNLATALGSQGRLTFLCWQGMQLNPWMLVPLEAALKHVPPPPIPAPDAPGPFAFADADRVRRLLGEAGFSGVDIAPVEEKLTVGGNVDFDEAVDFILKIGAVGRALDDADPSVVPAVTASIREALEPHRTPQGIRLPAAAWLVTGRRP